MMNWRIKLYALSAVFWGTALVLDSNPWWNLAELGLFTACAVGWIMEPAE